MIGLGEVVGMVSSGGGLALVVWAKVAKPYIKKRDLKKETQKKEIFAKEEEYRKKIDDIHNEMKMDGNGSLKTAVVKLQLGQDQIMYRLDGIEENIRVSMNLQGIAYWVSDTEGEFIYASPNLCKLLGRGEEELLGNNWLAWILSEDRERITSAWNFSVENNSAFDEVFKIKKPNGEIAQVWSTAFPKRVKKDLGGTLGKMVIIEMSKN